MFTLKNEEKKTTNFSAIATNLIFCLQVGVRSLENYIGKMCATMWCGRVLSESKFERIFFVCIIDVIDSVGIGTGWSSWRITPHFTLNSNDGICRSNSVDELSNILYIINILLYAAQFRHSLKCFFFSIAFSVFLFCHFVHKFSNTLDILFHLTIFDNHV